MKTFAPLIIFFLAVGVITAVGVLYDGRWRDKRVRKDTIEERRRAGSELIHPGEEGDSAGDEP
jgi:hypothetical protein